MDLGERGCGFVRRKLQRTRGDGPPLIWWAPCDTDRSDLTTEPSTTKDNNERIGHEMPLG